MVSTSNHKIKAFSIVLLSWAAAGLFLHFLFFWDFFAFFLCSLFVFLLILLGYTLLKNLTVTFSSSGYFNEILFGCEKERGPPRAELNMQKFN